MSFKGDLLKAGILTNGVEISIPDAGPEMALDKVSVKTISDASDVTLTTAQLLGGLILRDPNGGARTDTTPTASEIIDAIYEARDDTTKLLMIRNTADAAETITVAGGTGVTISGTATIAQNNTKIFLVHVDDISGGSEAVTLYSIGTLTH